MKRILIYGDSNSWGYPCDGSGCRMQNRWPVVLQRQMTGVEVIEENLPGRTTLHDDNQHMGKTNNGMRFLETALRSHAPLEAVVFLLGTNDFKARFHPAAPSIARNIGQLVKMTRHIGGGSRIWGDPTPPKVFVIAPPPLSDRALDPTWERVAEWSGGHAASQRLAAELRAEGARLNFAVLDSAPYVEGGAEDPIHWTTASHEKLGQAVAQWFAGQGV